MRGALVREQRERRAGARQGGVAPGLDRDGRVVAVGRREQAAPRRQPNVVLAGVDDREVAALVVEAPRDGRLPEKIAVILRVVVADARRRRAVGATPHGAYHGTAEDEPHGHGLLMGCSWAAPIDGIDGASH